MATGMNVPLHLSSTVDLIRGAVPLGVPDAEYGSLLTVLYRHFSDGSLVTLVCLLTGRDPGAVLNDVFAAGAGPLAGPDEVLRTHEMLVAAGVQ
jgi:hypothetical protein